MIWPLSAALRFSSKNQPTSWQIDNLLARVQRYWLAKPPVTLANGFITAFILYQLAQWTWKILPLPELPPAPTSQSVPHLPSSSTDSPHKRSVDDIAQYHLFGKTSAQEGQKSTTFTQTPSAKPSTKLNLKLTGLWFNPKDHTGMAIIVDEKGKTHAYLQGETIGETDAVLKKVYADRIEIERTQARVEVLLLDRQQKEGVPGKKGGKFSPQPLPIEPQEQSALPPGIPIPNLHPPTPNDDLAQDLQSLKGDIKEDPAKLLDVVRFRPIYQEGQLKGYRLSPGQKSKLFADLGLKPGDVVTSINGIELSDMKKSDEVMKQLQNATEVDLTVERQGNVESLHISL